jgi:predicted Zn finger-like uncharacterized protein
MHIVCPHCTTSFAIDPRAIGADGRTVRCARCRGTWFALPADAREEPALATAGAAAAAGAPGLPAGPHHAALPPGDDGFADHIPTVESPPIAGDPAIEVPAALDATARSAPVEADPGRLAGKPRLKRARKPATRRRRPARSGRAVAWPVACLASGLAVLSLVVWRAEVVRLLPQTAPLFRAIGLDVNLRGLAFRDVRTVREAVDGKPVLIVEGEVASVTGKAVELPRLRFAVRDGKGTEIYTWTAGLEQSSLAPGDTARFRSRLAEPPGEGRRVEVRFLNPHDLGG